MQSNSVKVLQEAILRRLPLFEMSLGLLIQNYLGARGIDFFFY